MTTYSMSDLAPYFVQYKEKFGEDCTLSLELMAEVIDGASNDDEVLSSMHEAMHFEGEVVTDNDDDRSAGDLAITEGSAYEYAVRMDDQFIKDLETNAQAVLENKRGAVVLMLDLERIYGRDEILKNWPVPGSEAKDVNNPDKYEKMVTDPISGETKKGKGSWYADLFDASKPGKELAAKLSSWKAAKANEKGKHILPEHAKMAGDELKLTAEKSRLDTFRTSKKNAIIRAVNVIIQMQRLNEETQMAVELITNDDGTPYQSNKLFYVYNKKKRSEFRPLTVGQLLALSVDKAKAAGGEYAHVMGTTGRGPKGGEKGEQKVTLETIPQFDNITAEYATFFEKMRADTKAMNAFLTHLNGAGSDDLLLSLNSIMTDIDSYLSKPGLAKRISALLSDERKEASKAAA